MLHAFLSTGTTRTSRSSRTRWPARRCWKTGTFRRWWIRHPARVRAGTSMCYLSSWTSWTTWSPGRKRNDRKLRNERNARTKWYGRSWRWSRTSWPTRTKRRKRTTWTIRSTRRHSCCWSWDQRTARTTRTTRNEGTTRTRRKRIQSTRTARTARRNWRNGNDRKDGRIWNGGTSRTTGRSRNASFLLSIRLRCPANSHRDVPDTIHSNQWILQHAKTGCSCSSSCPRRIRWRRICSSTFAT